MLSATCTADDDHFNVPGNFEHVWKWNTWGALCSVSLCLLCLIMIICLHDCIFCKPLESLQPQHAVLIETEQEGLVFVWTVRGSVTDGAHCVGERERESRYLNPLPEFRASTLMKIYCSALTNAGLLVAISHWIIIFNLEVQLQWKAHHFSNHTSLEK